MKLPILKSKKQSSHMRTSKTGKVYIAGSGAKKEGITSSTIAGHFQSMTAEYIDATLQMINEIGEKRPSNKALAEEVAYSMLESLHMKTEYSDWMHKDEKNKQATVKALSKQVMSYL